MTITAGSLAAASVISLPAIMLFFPTQPISLNAWLSVILVAILSTVIAFALFNILIKQIGSTPAATASLLTPVFGVLWGVLLLNETFSIVNFVGALIILLGSALTLKLFPLKPIPKITAPTFRRKC